MFWAFIWVVIALLWLVYTVPYFSMQDKLLALICALMWPFALLEEAIFRVFHGLQWGFQKLGKIFSRNSGSN